MNNNDTNNKLAIDGGEPIRTAPWPARRLFGEEEKAAVDALFDRCIETGEVFSYDGVEESAYCREFAEFQGGGFADGVNSGTTAVYVALRALELEPFTEVIVPPITDPGGMMAVPLMNCIPIVADSAPNSLNMGAEQVAARITERTSAIVVAHIAGTPADMDPLLEVARAKGIPVVEDCAQAHGARYKGRNVGTIGDIAAFSTMSGKHHATGSQGGVVFTQSEELYWRARRYSDRGKPFNMSAEGGNVAASLNFNMGDLSACVGRVQLKKLPEIVARRRRFALAVAQECETLQSVKVDTGPADAESAFWFLVFQLDLEKVAVDKATFARALAREGLPIGESYLHLFTSDSWYKNRAVFGSSGYPWTSPAYGGDPDQEYPVPNTLSASRSLFTLGMHENLGEGEVADVVAALRKVEKAYLK